MCTECGATSAKWLGRCTECGSWGTVVERSAAGPANRVDAAAVPDDRRAVPITKLASDHAVYWPTGIGEFDRVLGGGIVPGAAMLLSGEPGVGKSTLLLELAARIASTGARVLYVSAEESTSQVRLRAERTGALQPTLYLASESDLATILGHIEQVDPMLFIADSIQTIASADVSSLAGQPSQVREVASALIRIAKDRNLPTVIIGHVTKDGQVAGPRLLEHLVDVVAHVEGDRQTSLRFVRTLKNRYGATDEVGCFEMTGDGMTEVADPSSLFLAQRGAPVSGTCVTVALEGRRAMAVEIQALVVKTSAPNPRTVTNGVDSSRVAMLVAVLQQRLSLNFAGHDVYVSTMGGMRLVEPGADLAIATALASALMNRPAKPRSVVIGEVSLVGEIRPVTQQRMREAEATRVGLTDVVDASLETVHAAIGRALLPAAPRGE
ncbi:DNA repair protein RadA [Pseudoclavibacter endophyticus]|nr:DNA repair protein RadA [Pseudoclavibacter endophyticus]